MADYMEMPVAPTVFKIPYGIQHWKLQRLVSFMDMPYVSELCKVGEGKMFMGVIQEVSH